jgi:hypothetical protein
MSAVTPHWLAQCLATGPRSQRTALRCQATPSGLWVLSEAALNHLHGVVESLVGKPIA